MIIKEWAAYKGKSPQTPELVEALAFREWTCPNLKKLWLGKAVEDKNRRMRAFLACMRSDTPAMLNPTNVPTHLMVLCCVLRSVLSEGKTEWNKVFTVQVNLCDIFNTTLAALEEGSCIIFRTSLLVVFKACCILQGFFLQSLRNWRRKKSCVAKRPL